MKHLQICLYIVLLTSYWTLHSQNLSSQLNQLTQSLVFLETLIRPELTPGFMQELISNINYYDQVSVETTLRYLIQYRQLPGNAEAFPSQEKIIRSYEWIHLFAKALANDIVSASTRLTSINTANQILKEKVYEVRSDILNLAIPLSYQHSLALSSLPYDLPLIILNNLCQKDPKSNMLYIVPLLLGNINTKILSDIPQDIKNCIASMLTTIIENGQKTIDQNWYNDNYLTALLQVVRFYPLYTALPDQNRFTEFMDELALYARPVNLGTALSLSTLLKESYDVSNVQEAVNKVLNQKMILQLSALPVITHKIISYNELQPAERPIALTALLNTLCSTKKTEQLKDLAYVIVKLEELRARLPVPSHLPHDYDKITNCIKKVRDDASKTGL